MSGTKGSWNRDKQEDNMQDPSGKDFGGGQGTSI